MWLLMSFGGLLLFAIAITALVLGAVAVARDNSGGTFTNAKLVHPLFVGGGTPTVALSTTTNGVDSATIAVSPQNNDSAGTVSGTLTAATGVTEFTITFSKPFSQTPAAVLISPIAIYFNQSNPTLVTSLTTTGFVVRYTKVTTAGPIASAPFFYYTVV